MSLQVVQGTTGVVTPSASILDTGWSANGNTLQHGGCNPGTAIAANSFGLQVGRAYVFSYVVTGLISGGVKLIAGTTAGTYNTTNGTFTQTLTVTGNNFLSFYSDGTLTVTLLSFYDLLTGQQPGMTISFNERENKWVSQKSYQPEVYVTFLNKLFTFFQGNLWSEYTNSVMNNFYGVQSSSYITFLFNKDHETNKLWYNLRMDAVGNWYVDSMTTSPDNQFPNGMASRLTTTNIKSIDGKLWADILRDMTDPNFYQIPDPQLRAAVALFQGRVIQSPILTVTLRCDDVTPAWISSIEAYYTDVMKGL